MVLGEVLLIAGGKEPCLRTGLVPVTEVIAACQTLETRAAEGILAVAFPYLILRRLYHKRKQVHLGSWPLTS